MTDTTESDTQHTAWCDPAECATAPPGWHQSTSRSVTGHDPEGIHPGATVHAVQLGTGDDSHPYIDMTIHTEPGDGTDTEDQAYTVLLIPERALTLGHLLTTAARAAMRQQAG